MPLDAVMLPYGDQALREVTKRLLGHGATGLLDETLPDDHPAMPAQMAAWASTMSFLETRVQLDSHASGRPVDMGKEAGNAFKAVLKAVGALARDLSAF